MKVKECVEIVDDIYEDLQVLYSSSPEEGTHITHATAQNIIQLLNGYEKIILNMDVVE